MSLNIKSITFLQLKRFATLLVNIKVKISSTISKVTVIFILFLIEMLKYKNLNNALIV